MKLLLLLIPSLLFAAKGVVISETTRLTATTGMGTMGAATTLCIEGRFHGVTTTVNDNSNIISIGGLEIVQLANGSLRFNAPLDTSGDGTNFDRDVSAYSDYVFRYCRKPSTNVITLESWQGNGTVIESTSRTFTAFGSTSMGTLSVGKTSGTASWAGTIAFLRVYTTSIAVGSVPPHGEYRTGASLRYEFEDVITDSSGNGANLSIIAGAVSYGVSPTYTPFCTAGTADVFRAGVSNTLDGSGAYPLDEGGSLTYQWQQLTGPTNVKWSSRTTENPTITGTQFGQYSFGLVVTDATGNKSARCDVIHGFVGTDSSGNVVISNADHAEILGEMQMFGVGVWEGFDYWHRRLTDQFGEMQDTEWFAWWDTPVVGGTIDVTTSFSDALLLQVNGVNAQTTFCGGDTTPDKHLVIFANGGNSRRIRGVDSCPDATHVEVNTWLEATESGLQFAAVTEAQLAVWVGTSSNANYYDGVMAFYAMYYRTGLTKYLTYARWLADYWYRSPAFDQGQNDGDPDTTAGTVNRVKATTGLVMRALEIGSGSTMWTGLRLVANTECPDIDVTSGIEDVREESQMVGFCALMAKYDPVALNRTTYRAYVKAAITDRWGPQRRVNGEWANLPASGFTWGMASWAGGPGTVTVVNGGTTITFSGDLTSDSCTAIMARAQNIRRIWTASADKFVGGDARDYEITACTHAANTVTISEPYEGSSSAGRTWFIDAAGGYYVQPFILAYAGTNMIFARNALLADEAATAATVDTWIIGIANWLKNSTYGGLRASHGGFWYARYYAPMHCSTNPELDPGGLCTQSADGNEPRFLFLESVRIFSEAYSLAGGAEATAIKDAADLYYGSAYGVWPTGSGGPNAPVADRPDEPSDTIDFDSGTDKGKVLGFTSGFGGGYSWPAARIGGVAAESTSSISVRFRAANIPNVDHVDVTVTRPDGSSATTNCGTTSPCAVSIDSRQSTANVTITYVLTNGLTRVHKRYAVN
jgi:hypothetical protein